MSFSQSSVQESWPLSANCAMQAGMVCVFDKHGLTTFHDQNYQKREEKVFTFDERDAKTGLYPLSLFRKIEQKNSIHFAAVPTSKKKNREKTMYSWQKPSPLQLLTLTLCLWLFLRKHMFAKVYLLLSDTMQSVATSVSSISNVPFPSWRFRNYFDVNFVSKVKFTSSDMDPANRGEGRSTSPECVSTLTTRVPTRSHTVVPGIPNYFWTVDQATYGLFACEKDRSL